MEDGKIGRMEEWKIGFARFSNPAGAGRTVPRYHLQNVSFIFQTCLPERENERKNK